MGRKNKSHNGQTRVVTTRVVERIYKYIQGQRNDGASCDDASAALNIQHQTASPRFNEMVRSGLLIHKYHCGEPVQRLTRSGRLADVYVLAPKMALQDFDAYMREEAQVKAKQAQVKRDLFEAAAAYGQCRATHLMGHREVEEAAVLLKAAAMNYFTDGTD